MKTCESLTRRQFLPLATSAVSVAAWGSAYAGPDRASIRAKRLLGNQPVLAESFRLRNPFVDPVQDLQLQFLRRWRRHPTLGLRRLLGLAVNGIAFGMKTTG